LVSIVTFFILQAGAAWGATLTVNDSSAGVTCNQSLSLSEASRFAGDGSSLRNLTDGEKNQISGVTWLAFPPDPNCSGAIWRAAVGGGVGRFVADFIFFSNAVNQINDYVLLDRDDWISGMKPNSTKVILDGTGVGNIDGITFLSFNDNLSVTTNAKVSNLVIRNFQRNGISAGYARGSVFEGLEIYNNGMSGISFPGNSEANPRTIRIGGTQANQRNYIYTNGLDGIRIIASPIGDRVALQGIDILNNFIGTSNGTSDDGNQGNGIYLENAFGVIVGDPTGATRNVISGNNNDGIKIVGQQSYSNEVIGNFIGTDSSGGTAVGNSASGIALLSGAGSEVNFVSKTPNLIGKPGLGNVISANSFGIFIADNNTSNNWVQANKIGTNLGGNSDIGNGADGVILGGGTFDNKIGGSGANEGNQISFNRAGINAEGGIRNRFQRNQLFGNDNLGIDLGTAGVTQNDTGDPDTGANNLQNFPVITYVYATSSTVRIQGTLNSIASKPFTVELFGNTSVDTTGYGEGRNYLGATTVNTNATGNGTFDVTFNVPIATVGQYVSATATDETNNTSEFSPARNICADTVLSPFGLLAEPSSFTGTFTVTRSTGCSSATPSSNVPWITVNSFLAGTVNYTIAPNAGPQRNGSIIVQYNNGSFLTFVSFNVTQVVGVARAPFDFDGDGKTDVSIFRPSNGQWWYLRSSDGQNRAFQFGDSTDKLTPADYTGDGKTDIGYWKPSTGEWYVLRSENFTYYAFPFGNSSDVPVPGDYDGDNITDAAVFRPSTATWYISRSTGGSTAQAFGASTDIPVRGDYDGDGKSDIAIFRPSNGQWWILQSSNGLSTAATFGTATDKLVPGDYTGDGKTDIAFWRPSTGEWYVLRSEDQSYYAVPFGLSSDLPVTGDYDGDGKWDPAVFRPSTNTWYLQRTTAGIMVQGFGAAGDKPVPAAYLP